MAPAAHLRLWELPGADSAVALPFGHTPQVVAEAYRFKSAPGKLRLHDHTCRSAAQAEAQSALAL